MQWNEVVWTEAWQATVPQGWTRMEGDDAPPPAFFGRLRQAGRTVEAVRFLACALPRFRAVQWLHGVIARDAPHADKATLAAIGRWLDNPTDEARRAAFDSALPLSADDPAKLCGTAVLFASGSPAPEGAPTVPAPRQAAGQFVAGGVLQCAFATEDPGAALDRALDAGAALATGSGGPA